MAPQPQQKQDTVKEYIRRFIKDIPNRKTAPLKLFNFAIIAGVSCMFQFYTVHMISLGISKEQISVLNTILPILTFLTAPMAGALSDKIGKPKVFANVGLLLSLLSHLALLLVPPREKKEESSGGVDITLISYLIVRGATGVFLPVVLGTIDGLTMAVSRQRGGEYNFQKFYGAISGCIAPPVVGYLIEVASRGQERQNFAVAFYFFALSQAACMVIISLLDLPKPQAKDKATGNAKEIFRNPLFVSFLICGLLSGAYFAFMETFLIVFLGELGATTSLYGLRASVAGIASIPIMFFAGFIVDKFGHVNIFAFTFIAYAFRLFSLSFISDPYHCLFIEPAEALTFALYICSFVTYNVKIVPPNFIASAQGLAMGLFMGLGKSVGSLVGGVLVSYIGMRPTFRVLALVAVLAGSTYYLLYNTWLKELEKKTQQKTEKQEKKKK